jgi:hypothetical protein
MCIGGFSVFRSCLLVSEWGGGYRGNNGMATRAVSVSGTPGETVDLTDDNRSRKRDSKKERIVERMLAIMRPPCFVSPFSFIRWFARCFLRRKNLQRTRKGAICKWSFMTKKGNCVLRRIHLVAIRLATPSGEVKAFPSLIVSRLLLI